jgi:hypothetical protein
MANGTLKVSNIQTSSGSGTITIGASGETVDLSNGTMTLNSSMKNTPSFYAYLSANQDVTNGGFTKVTVDTEVFDSDGAYDNSTNYRFTPQTAGKYFVFGSVELYAGGNSQVQSCDPSIYKNGSRVIKGGEDYRTGYPRNSSPKVSGIVECNGSSDYIELYIGNDITSGDALAQGSSDQRTHFGAYRIVGA